MFSIQASWWRNQLKHVACFILSYMLCVTDFRQYICNWKQQVHVNSKDDLTFEIHFLLLLRWHQYILTVALDPENQLNYITLHNYINIQPTLIWCYSSFEFSTYFMYNFNDPKSLICVKYLQFKIFLSSVLRTTTLCRNVTSGLHQRYAAHGGEEATCHSSCICSTTTFNITPHFMLHHMYCHTLHIVSIDLAVHGGPL